MYTEELEQLLRKVIARILQEQIEQQNPKHTYIVFHEEWDNRYYLLLDELKTIQAKGVYAITLSDQISDLKEQIGNLYSFEKILLLEECNIVNDTDIVVFPVMHRDEVIHIVQGYSNTKVTKLVRNCFENAVSIYCLRYGIEKLTGKEPEKYQQKILSYYREMLEYGIEMIENIKAVM